MVGAAEAATAEAVEEAVEEAAVGVETPPLQGDTPQATPQQEETTGSLDSPRTCSQETARRRRSFSRNGNSTIT